MQRKRRWPSVVPSSRFWLISVDFCFDVATDGAILRGFLIIELFNRECQYTMKFANHAKQSVCDAIEGLWESHGSHPWARIKRTLKAPGIRLLSYESYRNQT